MRLEGWTCQIFQKYMARINALEIELMLTVGKSLSLLRLPQGLKFPSTQVSYAYRQPVLRSGSARDICPEWMGLICVMSWMDTVYLLHV